MKAICSRCQDHLGVIAWLFSQDHWVNERRDNAFSRGHVPEEAVRDAHDCNNLESTLFRRPLRF